ncbi:MAG: hypothetical protein IJR02_12250 [Bacteroidaceae bacterium]|nr:hypothetical protein [Bacteroidaceae bacterium]
MQKRVELSKHFWHFFAFWVFFLGWKCVLWAFFDARKGRKCFLGGGGGGNGKRPCGKTVGHGKGGGGKRREREDGKEKGVGRKENGGRTGRERRGGIVEKVGEVVEE